MESSYGEHGGSKLHLCSPTKSKIDQVFVKGRASDESHTSGISSRRGLSADIVGTVSERVGEHANGAPFGDTSRTCRTSDKDDLQRRRQQYPQKEPENTHIVDLLLLHVSVLEHLLHGLHRLPEHLHIDLLKLGTRKRLRTVVPALKALNLQLHARLGTQRALRLPDLALELAHGTELARDIGARLLLVELDKVLDDALVNAGTWDRGIEYRPEWSPSATFFAI